MKKLPRSIWPLKREKYRRCFPGKLSMRFVRSRTFRRRPDAYLDASVTAACLSRCSNYTCTKNHSPYTSAQARQRTAHVWWMSSTRRLGNSSNSVTRPGFLLPRVIRPSSCVRDFRASLAECASIRVCLRANKSLAALPKEKAKVYGTEKIRHPEVTVLAVGDTPADVSRVKHPTAWRHCIVFFRLFVRFESRRRASSLTDAHTSLYSQFWKTDAFRFTRLWASSLVVHNTPKLRMCLTNFFHTRRGGPRAMSLVVHGFPCYDFCILYFFYLSPTLWITARSCEGARTFSTRVIALFA